MSVEKHRQKIAHMVRERLETNAVDSLESLRQEITESLELDRSEQAQAELSAFLRSLYDQFQRVNTFDYDDVVEQSFPASDPPPPPAP